MGKGRRRRGGKAESLERDLEQALSEAFAGGSFEQLKLEDLGGFEGMEGPEGLEALKEALADELADLDGFEGLDGVEGLQALTGLHGFGGLEKALGLGEDVEEEEPEEEVLEKLEEEPFRVYTDEPPPLSKALRAAASGPAAAEGDLGDAWPPELGASLEALGPSPASQERLWAAAALMFGVPAEPGSTSGIARNVARAEGLLLEALGSEQALASCADCATLWGFGALRGAFAAPAPAGSPVASLAAAHGLPEPAAAFALAARLGGPLGQLVWGELRADGAVAWQHSAAGLAQTAERRLGGRGRRAVAAEVQAPMWGAAPPEASATPSSSSSDSAEHREACVESLHLLLSVASSAMPHEHTPVPQPVDLEHLASARRDGRQQYALAAQLAEDGYAEGLAAKAEMLYFGRNQVVPGAWTIGRHLPEASTILAASIIAAFAAFLASQACRHCCSPRRRPRAAASPARELAASGAPPPTPSLQGARPTPALPPLVAPAPQAPRPSAAEAGGDATARAALAAAAVATCKALLFLALALAVGLGCLVWFEDALALDALDAGDLAAALGLDLGELASLDGFGAEPTGKTGLDASGAAPVPAPLAAKEAPGVDGASAPRAPAPRPPPKRRVAKRPALGALKKDEARAQDMFREAAEAGHWGAAYALAMILLDGKDRSRAAPWLEQVAEQGDDRAHSMARHFQHRWGLGQSKDARLAGEYLHMAAVLGEPNAALLLAEAHASEGDAPEVEPPGGRNVSTAVEFYRSAAAAGRSTCRFNIGVLLLRLHGGLSQAAKNMTFEACREVRAEFAEVATDLDPTLRLFFALALRSWELGDPEGALGIFMLLSEAGSVKAHRNAARLWEDAILPNARLPDEDVTQASATLAAGAAAEPAAAPTVDVPAAVDAGAREAPAEAADCPDSAARPAAAGRAGGEGSAAGPSDVGVVLRHEGEFCCPGGRCREDGDCDCTWLLNEGGWEPMACVRQCVIDPRCGFATLYASGYCQLSAECAEHYPAGDATAHTYAVRRAPPFEEAPPQASCGDGAGAACASETSPGEAPEAPTEAAEAGDAISWCWPPSADRQSRSSARRCAAASFARAASAAGERGAPLGSALASGVGAAEASALSAARHLEQLGQHGAAHTWYCRAARRFSSDHGTLRCSSLEASAWDGHARNLTRAWRELRALTAAGGERSSLPLAASLALTSLAVEYFGEVVGSCRLELAQLTVTCAAAEVIVAEWGAPPELAVDSRHLETAIAAVALSAAAALSTSALVFLARRCSLRTSGARGRQAAVVA